MKNNTIILFIVLIFIVGSIYYLESSKVKPQDISGIEIPPFNQDNSMENSQYPSAPELTGIEGYINTPKDTKISDFNGKVVLIDFWTYSCINCIRTFPYLNSWNQKYKDLGLIIIGVHTPEFEFEKDYNNVKDAIEKYNITYPVVQDNNYATWKAFNNRFWPRKYLMDSEGYIRYDHIGEGAYEETELKIQELLAEIGENIDEIKTSEDEIEIRFTTTPELYAGFNFALSRGQNIGNSEGIQPNSRINYTLPEEIIKDIIYLEGEWQSNSDNLELTSKQGILMLNFTAKSVNIVASSPKNQEIGILIDNFLSDKTVINKPQLYNIFSDSYGNYRLLLKVKEGFTFNAFTFG
jgi:thiol-disulfide isomerase/thioredoxin